MKLRLLAAADLELHRAAPLASAHQLLGAAPR